MPNNFEISRWDKVVKVESKKGELLPINQNKEEIYALFDSLDLYIEESSGMCQQTDECWSGSDYGKKHFITNDYQVFSHYRHNERENPFL